GVCPGSSSTSCNMLVGTVQTTGVNGTAAHVHQGAPGENGPVIVTLIKQTADVWTVPNGTVLTDAQYQAYVAGNLYVNVHTDANKGGEFRAQLRPAPRKFCPRGPARPRSRAASPRDSAEETRHGPRTRHRHPEHRVLPPRLRRGPRRDAAAVRA